MAIPQRLVYYSCFIYFYPHFYLNKKKHFFLQTIDLLSTFKTQNNEIVCVFLDLLFSLHNGLLLSLESGLK